MVDVGGNLGHVALEVARVHKHVRVVVEDREIVLKESKAASNVFSYTKPFDLYNIISVHGRRTLFIVTTFTI